MTATKIRAYDGMQSNTLINDYTVWSDYLLDMELLPYDIQWSVAHAKMLVKIGILTSDEGDKIVDMLIGDHDHSIINLHKNGQFSIQKEQEDGHTAIEDYLTQKLGDVGKKIHTGRSRNDQILVTMRLFTLNAIKNIGSKLDALVNAFDQQSTLHHNQLMPWYTHTQKAMPSSVGMWLGSFKDALVDDQKLLDVAYTINDQNPLWSAAGFGQHIIPIDREYTSKELGFSQTQENPMYCALSRGKFENIVLQALSNVMSDIGKFANDMVWFTSKEFAFFDLPEIYKTWSSIMPNKHNFDVLELMRGNLAIFFGYQFQVQEVIKWLFSWYNRDLQLTKEPYLKAMKLCIDTITVATMVVTDLIVNKEILETACSGDIYATQKAYELVKQWIPFRDAYQQVKNDMDKN